MVRKDTKITLQIFKLCDFVVLYLVTWMIWELDFT